MKEFQIIGNLGTDPVIKTSKKDNKWCTLNVAVSVKIDFDDPNSEYKTDWFKILAFGYLAENASAYKKGDKVFIKGNLSIEKREIVLKENDGTEKVINMNITNYFAKTMLCQSKSPLYKEKQQYNTPNDVASEVSNEETANDLPF